MENINVKESFIKKDVSMKYSNYNLCFLEFFLEFLNINGE